MDQKSRTKWDRSVLQSVGLSILSAVLCFLSFPPVDFGFLAWGALIPLFYVLSKTTFKRAAVLIFIWGFTFYALLMYWTSGFKGIGLIAPLAYGVLYGLYHIPAGLLYARRPLPIVAAVTFTAFDYLRSSGVFSLTWGELGYTQYVYPTLTQAASFTGVFGITFMIIFINAAIVGVIWHRDPRSLGFALFCVVLAVGYGHFKLAALPSVRQVPVGERSVRFAAIQGNLLRGNNWEHSPTNTWNHLTDMTIEAGRYRPDVIVWSETVMLLFLNTDDVIQGAVQRLADQTRASIIVGAPSLEGEKIKKNSLLLFIPGAGLSGRYDKLHLVPFGEMVPYIPSHYYENIPLASSIQDFTPGEEYKLLRAPSADIGGLICFEGAFGDIGLTAARAGANVLLNVTNDAWSGFEGAHEQHFALSVLRSVETGIPLVRCGNTGVSAHVDSWGRIVKRTPVFTPAIMIADVVPSSARTFYARKGDLFAQLCLIAAVILQSAIKRKRVEFPDDKGSWQVRP